MSFVGRFQRICGPEYCRSIATTSYLCKTSAGKHKVTRYQTKGLTYEQAQKPWHIGERKAWLTWHTQDLEGFEQRQPQVVMQDLIIRKFLSGIWITRFDIFATEPIIKRRGNLIIIAGLVSCSIPASKMYWLIGYTEELLSLTLKQPVKLELQTVKHKNDLIFKYI